MLLKIAPVKLLQTPKIQPPCLLRPGGPVDPGPSRLTPRRLRLSTAEETRRLLTEIETSRARLCRWQRLLTFLSYRQATGGEVGPDLLFAQDRLRNALRDLDRARESLKIHDVRAFNVHTYGLAVVLEGDAPCP